MDSDIDKFRDALSEALDSMHSISETEQKIKVFDAEHGSTLTQINDRLRFLKDAENLRLAINLQKKNVGFMTHKDILDYGLENKHQPEIDKLELVEAPLKSELNFYKDRQRRALSRFFKMYREKERLMDKIVFEHLREHDFEAIHMVDLFNDERRPKKDTNGVKSYSKPKKSKKPKKKGRTK